MNEDLIAEIQALSAIGSEEKFSEIIRLLKKFDFRASGEKESRFTIVSKCISF